MKDYEKPISDIIDDIMSKLELLGNERTKKSYMKNGVLEPVFGVTVKDLKTILKEYKYNQVIANLLFETGNYDAMYLAGMMANIEEMSEIDFDNWIKKAYCYMISDYIVAISLAESKLAFAIANKWIESKNEFEKSAGWSCYVAMIGNRKDEEFSIEDIKKKLEYIEKILINDDSKKADNEANEVDYKDYKIDNEGDEVDYKDYKVDYEGHRLDCKGKEVDYEGHRVDCKSNKVDLENIKVEQKSNMESYNKIDKLSSELENKFTINDQTNASANAMINFVMATGISYIPLSKNAMELAKVLDDNIGSKAFEYIKNAVDKGRLGFKRKHVRC